MSPVSSLHLMQEALKVLEFSEDEIRDMFKLLSGVLQLGNIEFMTAGGAQITTKQGQSTCRRITLVAVSGAVVSSFSLPTFQWSPMPASYWAWTPSSCPKSLRSAP